MSGHVDELPILEDSEFGVAERCMKLVRMVEMYQYTEHKTTSTRKDGRGGEIRETVRVCVCLQCHVCVLPSWLPLTFVVAAYWWCDYDPAELSLHF